MANRTVAITKRVMTDKGKRFCPAVESGNHRLNPDVVLVGGKKETHVEGCYYLDWSEGARRVRLSVGKDSVEAWRKKIEKEAELAGVKVDKDDSSKPTLADAISAYLEETKLTKKPLTAAAQKTALSYFTESCHKLNVADITRNDLLKFAAFLRDEKKLAPHTVYNKFKNVVSFLKAQKVRDIVGKNDWPVYTEEEPEIYERADIEKLFTACNEEERLWYTFFLMTGMREQEVMHTYWTDVNFAASTVKVSHKPDFGWTPKAYKEREIPIPATLVSSLKAWKAKSDRGCPLVFPTVGCKPKRDFLKCLYRVAGVAGIKDAILHKFRATFATWALWGGVDLRTVQQWLGHSDMESTMRYLKPSRSAAVQNKVNVIFDGV
jgi:integrase